MPRDGCSNPFGFNQEDQEKLGKLAAQRNRLAHRYLNFRWQVIRIFKDNRRLLLDFIKKILELEKSRETDAAQ